MDGLWWQLLLFPSLGASIHIIQKFLFECVSMGTLTVHKFHKPMFLTWLSSVGLFSTFLYSVLLNWRQFRSKWVSSSFSSAFLLVGLSTFLNIFVGALSNYTSLYLNYSVSLMLRSSTVIIGAAISVFYLKKTLQRYQLIGVFTTLASLLVVGTAESMSRSTTTHRTAATSVVLLHLVLRALSKSFQAVAMLIEERLMAVSRLTPVELSGLGGVWSLLIGSALAFFLEDFWDTWAMVGRNSTIFALSLAIVAVFATWNVLALRITSQASALARMMFEQLTIVVVWFAQLAIHWFIQGSGSEEQFGKAGEKWTAWSWLQLFGFALMVVGACVYQQLIELPSGRRNLDESHKRLLQRQPGLENPTNRNNAAS
jgi:drug/metabolite transporter (DMT)-like permease